MSDVEDAELVPIELNKETVKCFSCKHYQSHLDLGELAYTFPCTGTTIATHGPLPVAHICNGEPSALGYSLYAVANPKMLGETIPDVVECRNYKKK